MIELNMLFMWHDLKINLQGFILSIPMFFSSISIFANNFKSYHSIVITYLRACCTLGILGHFFYL